jgi:hypothetical protein
VKYLKVWTNFREVISSLTDAEIGRLFLAMLDYVETGEELQEFIGNERFLWAAAKRDIDMTNAKQDILRQNGLKGGRPKSKENQSEPNETNENQIEPNESLKEKKRKEKKENENNNGRFTPPTIEQVTEYCRENRISIPVTRWFNYYTANGWKVGKNPMKDWKAAVRMWERNERDGQYGSPGGVSDGKVRSAYSFLDEQSGAV